ncbi:MAG: saccharopine dehydrogenase NADP-binding domain-containing protein, partial [Acidimicrobiia bacterium]|nr:saccharopine dehydrogenase NADP-binding domain-containing protein [Acidimicrobiia bacterium]
MTERHDRTYDITAFGATSFVGQLVVDHLLARHGTGRGSGSEGREGDVRWAVAGRNRAKLEQLLEARGVELPIVVADADDRDSLDQLASDTRVVVSTVGPYALYGSNLVAAVAAAGTDYCDLTGEPHWVQAM